MRRMTKRERGLTAAYLKYDCTPFEYEVLQYSGASHKHQTEGLLLKTEFGGVMRVVYMGQMKVHKPTIRSNQPAIHLPYEAQIKERFWSFGGHVDKQEAVYESMWFWRADPMDEKYPVYITTDSTLLLPVEMWPDLTEILKTFWLLKRKPHERIWV